MGIRDTKVLFLRERWGHMSEVSGFDPLFSMLHCQLGESACSLFVPKSLELPSHFSRLSARLKRGGHALKATVVGLPDPAPFVERRHTQVVLHALSRVRRNSGEQLFLTVAENQFARELANAPADILSRVIVCLHQPPAYLRLHWRDFSVLNGLRAVVCLSESQRAFVRDLCDSETILLRHGVCGEFFKPAASGVPQRRNRLLFVGQWLRDFETLYESMQSIWSVDPTVELDCVVPRFARSHPALLKLARSENVSWHCDLSPERLLSLYQNATLLFLPLIDAAANNAIVEALACGLPIVSSHVGGIPDYLTRECGTLCAPGDAEAHAKAALDWMGDKPRCGLARKACREWAEQNLSWETIAGELIEAIGLERCENSGQGS